MSPEDLLAACVAWLADSPLLSRRSAKISRPPPPLIKFWSDYAGPTEPALPYLVFAEPQMSESHETADNEWNISAVYDGVVIFTVFDESKTTARQLGDQCADALFDADMVFGSGLGLVLFRPTNRAFPIITNIGPGGIPTSFGRQVQFRFIIERNVVETLQGLPPLPLPLP